MHLQSIVLDATSTASATLQRLARYGLWKDPSRAEVRDRLAILAAGRHISLDEAATRLARDPGEYGVAIRRQWLANVLWYAFSAAEVLDRCTAADPDAPLMAVLDLHETDNVPCVDVQAEAPPTRSVLVDGAVPVAVILERPRDISGHDDSHALEGALPRARPGVVMRGGTRGGFSDTRAARSLGATTVLAWPRLDAPQYVPATVPFDVVVGLAATQQTGVSGGRITLLAPVGQDTIDVSVELIADGLDAPLGWSHVLSVPVADPTSTHVTFTLTPRAPAGPEPFVLTMLEVRYVVDGAICGAASRPLVIGPAQMSSLPAGPALGTPWLAQPIRASVVTLAPDPHAPDLTIELVRPRGNASVGNYVCRLLSPHAIHADRGPHQVDIGQDAKTFAQAIVDEARQYGNDPLIDPWLRGTADLVARVLPEAAFRALAEVSVLVAPAPPAVLIVSADPYVPWELALVDPPLDPTRPPYLGAQALVGRWISESGMTPGDATPRARQEKPPPRPLATIPVKHMAVMAGLYKPASGLTRLPSAELEATELTRTHKAIPLPATSEALIALLNARLARDFEEVAPNAVHFAGHGTFDVSKPDASRIYLSNGKPMSSIVFRSAKYGEEYGVDRQPFIFLNACMAGIGGEVLGDAGGFPGHCLRGGFGAILSALWEVDDGVAGEIATEFWARALPMHGGRPEPVAAVLRDLRARYGDGTDPLSTYLAYVYYGHPRLTLQPQA